MRNNIFHIVKKEFDRFFRDKRMVFTVILMPGLLIYAMYSLMGAGFSQAESVADSYATTCSVVNMPESFRPVFDALGFEITESTDPEAEKDLVRDKETDLLVQFPADFDASVMSGAEVPNIVIHYNSTSGRSSAAYELLVAAAERYEAALANVLDINLGVENPDLASDTDIASEMFASLIPLLLIMLLFSGCVSVAPESIAGEKERGTIATLLVTPVSRRDIAIGKIISLSVFALLSGISSFVGVMLALPKLLGAAASELDMQIYGAGEYVSILCVIASTVLLIVSIISVISAFAKSVKEATSMSSPLTLISSLASFVPMFAGELSSPLWRLIPIFNSVLSLNEIFSFTYSAENIAVTCVSNVIYMVLFVVLLSKMFNSERIMFKK